MKLRRNIKTLTPIQKRSSSVGIFPGSGIGSGIIIDYHGMSQTYATTPENQSKTKCRYRRRGNMEFQTSGTNTKNHLIPPIKFNCSQSRISFSYIKKSYRLCFICQTKRTFRLLDWPQSELRTIRLWASYFEDICGIFRKWIFPDIFFNLNLCNSRKPIYTFLQTHLKWSYLWDVLLYLKQSYNWDVWACTRHKYCITVNG